MFPAESGERLQKILARRGYGSRREAERLISEGRVSVNGRVARLGTRASSDDSVVVAGRTLNMSAIAHRHIVLHKPCGFVVSRRPQKRQRGIFELLSERDGCEWISVGRLDINTSGLLLLTNDGELAHRLMHPSTGVSRVYRVRVDGRASPAILQRLRNGVMLGARQARFDEIEEVRKPEGSGRNCWFRVSLREGRNREVRRLWESQGLQVNRLIRIAYGSIGLDVPSGRWRDLTDDEVGALYADAQLAPSAQNTRAEEGPGRPA